jgi:subtilisin family serine protease
MNIKSLLLVFTFLIFYSFNSTAQQRKANYVKGDLLVQTTPDGNIEQIVNDLKVVNGIETGIQLEKEVSNPMRIWLLKFNHANLTHNEMIAYAYLHDEISIAQVNHVIEERATIPNDQQFGQQWQYVNTGQSGGTVDADIDADSAWDISTGGLTALGDTIVVCIIDGGIDMNHNDLTPNRWFNYAEIPNNGIDDDNNGFIDDYLGWNTGSGTDNIAGTSHGTAVAGIIGAKGNNGTGVSGVNWDVKLMIVRGGTGVESEVLEAYTFPLTHRKRYNETNGAEGSFVVATNASWGVNNGQPENAPLWCAMYDTLGKYGILNAGAGPNANVNVDIVGDLPTACPSEYLITLTNMDHNDNKVTQAPIGPVTIDLGAHGEGTWTTTNNGYSGFGGTSGATPHVTGTIGLLYSANCPSFGVIAKANPSRAAELARDYILQSVDSNADLMNNTTTGGRLNLYNAMKNVIDSCAAADCLPPYDVTVSNLLDTSATITWTALTDTTKTYNFKYRALGDTVWSTILDTLFTQNLTNLSACMTYEIQVEMICDSSTSFSDITTFKTLGCCEFPTGLSAITLSDTSADLSWNSVFAANEYIINYRKTGTSTWMIDTVSNTMYSLTNLQLCTTYEYQIQTKCDTGSTSPSPIFTFASGCGACSANFCNSTGNTQFEFIESFGIDGNTFQSGDNGGYYRHEGVAITLDKTTYPVSFTPGFNGNGFSQYARVWVDFNQDGDFTDAGELATSFSATTNTASQNITVPVTAVEGITRMRIVMQYNSYAGVCENGYDGETEDYCIEITNVIPCEMPIALDTTSATINSIDLNWSTAATASAYLLRHRLVGATTWTEENISTNTTTINNLEGCKSYEVEVASICAVTGDTSAYSATFNAETRCNVGTRFVNNTISNIEVFPNPFSDYLTISMDLSNNQDVTVQILNVNGQLVQEELYHDLNGEQTLNINTSQIQVRGTYIVRLISDNGIVIRRIVK